METALFGTNVYTGKNKLLFAVGNLPQEIDQNLLSLFWLSDAPDRVSNNWITDKSLGFSGMTRVCF